MSMIYSATASVNPPSASKHLQHSIIPEPQVAEVHQGAGAVISGNTLLLATGCEEMNSANFLLDYLGKYYNLKIETVISESDLVKKIKKDKKTSVIELRIGDLSKVASLPSYGHDPADLSRDGAYLLEVREGRIVLTGANPAGLFHAVQTLIQLMPVPSQSSAQAFAQATTQPVGVQRQGTFAGELQISPITVLDFPRFEYRGMHLDVVRHIYSMDYIKQYLDYMAMHKMNYFHWHLTDDQGWRMESKSHPKLNETGAWRAGTIIGIFPGTGVDSTRYGGYYTIGQMKEIIEYATQRYITIVPEIDVPGHSMAIIATYPQFSTTPHIPKEPAITWGIFNRQNNVLAPSDEVFTFLEDVFNELMDVFPGQYIHIGADECAKKWWEESPETQQYMKDHGIEDENALQKYFAQRIAEVVHARGRKFVGWDEMLDDGLVEGAVVMSWRNAENGYKAAGQGHKTILTPMRHSYFNIAQKENEDSLCHRQWVVTLDDVYNFEPVPENTPSEVASNILGGQGCMWTEYFPHRQRLEYGIFPRMSAIAEVYWSNPQKKNWPRFQLKLVDQFDRYDLWGANYSTEIFRSSKYNRQ